MRLNLGVTTAADSAEVTASDMKNWLVLCLILSIWAFGCSKQKEERVFEKATPAYELAKELSAILPSLDPDVNADLVVSDTFTITAGEIIETILLTAGNQSNELKSMDSSQLRQVITESAIQFGERKLLERAAKKAGTVLTQEEINGYLQSQYDRAGGEEKFLEVLVNNGMDPDYVKKFITSDLLIQSYLETVVNTKIEIPDKEIQEAYKKDKSASVRHILLLTQGKNETEKAEIRKKMEEILTRAKAGEDFSELAKEFSEDPGSKDKGGFYEDFGRGRMVKPFEDAAFSVPVGEISDIVETTYGYHILKVVDRKKETRPFDDVRPELEAQIRQTKRNSFIQEHIEKLKEEISFQVREFD
jgi:parvulin-like peptidyl-prolyl isomerase